jgi:hypothetical protein
LYPVKSKPRLSFSMRNRTSKSSSVSISATA